MSARLWWAISGSDGFRSSGAPTAASSGLPEGFLTGRPASVAFDR
jgi:hypothetical protein